ncbi:MAG: type IV pilus twitching motility protein PilT [Bdellovibrionales bacterium]|nr:type IV pilus twitching motility protein PilT [Bdellovibrionales bacterium]
MSKLTLTALLRAMVDQDASDLHLSTGTPPQFRIHGRLFRAKSDVLTPDMIKELLYDILTEQQKKMFEANHELDFSFGVKDVARFRGNLLFQKGSMGGVFRRIPVEVPDFDMLKLPDVIKKVVRQPNGLFLVTGPTGSGKSTSLAAIIDYLNREENGHILTIEDPIEFIHPHKSCIVNQREIGADSHTFHDALKASLRQDPDYILVGELRDLETIEMALTAAETGHLVFATMHTNSAVQTIARVVNVFPPHQQPQIRQLLAATLCAVMTQQLVPNSGKSGRSLAAELLIPNLAVKNLIREDKMHQIYGVMQSGQGGTGMLTMNQSLVELIKKGNLTKPDALNLSLLPEELSKMV